MMRIMHPGPETIALPSESWRAFAALLNARLAALGVNKTDLSQVAGVSDTTIRKMARATAGSYRKDVFERVVAALYLPIADVEDLMEAGDPPDRLASHALDAASRDFRQRLKDSRTIDEPDMPDDLQVRVESIELRLARLEVTLSRIARHLGVE